MSNINSNNFLEQIVSTKSGRKFVIYFLKFQNGCLLSISEDKPVIGSLYVSTSASNKCQTAKVIPNMRDTIFVTSISERISLMINGFAIVNFAGRKALSVEEMKEISLRIMDLTNEFQK